MNKEETYKEEIMIELIKEVFPVEYEIAGHTGIKDTMKGAKFKSPTGGAWIDFESTLGLIAAIITVANEFYKIIDHFYTSNKKNEAQDNLALNAEIKLLLMEAKSEAKSSKNTPKEVIDKLDEIIAILMEKLKK